MMTQQPTDPETEPRGRFWSAGPRTNTVTALRGNDLDRGAVWHDLILAAHLLQDALERQSQRDGRVPHGHFKVLALLSAAEGQTLGLTTLADMLRFSPSRISHTLTAVERRGLVIRRRIPGGRRAYEATLTDQGRRLVARVLRGQRTDVRDAVLDSLDVRDVAALGKISARVVEVLDRTDA